jgi:hypothetical protein
MLDLSKTKSSDNGIRRTDQEEVTIIFLMTACCLRLRAITLALRVGLLFAPRI